MGLGRRILYYSGGGIDVDHVRAWRDSIDAEVSAAGDSLHGRNVFGSFQIAAILCVGQARLTKKFSSTEPRSNFGRTGRISGGVNYD